MFAVLSRKGPRKFPKLSHTERRRGLENFMELIIIVISSVIKFFTEK